LYKLLSASWARYFLGIDDQYDAVDKDEPLSQAGANACALRAFQAGCYSYLSAGYRFGDPSEYLHPRTPPHPHHSKPELHGTCEGCTPPVHGSVLLLYTDPETGQVMERRGNRNVHGDVASPDAPGMGTMQRVGLLAHSLGSGANKRSGRLLLRRGAQIEAISSVEEEKSAVGEAAAKVIHMQRGVNSFKAKLKTNGGKISFELKNSPGRKSANGESKYDSPSKKVKAEPKASTPTPQRVNGSSPGSSRDKTPVRFNSPGRDSGSGSSRDKTPVRFNSPSKEKKVNGDK